MATTTFKHEFEPAYFTGDTVPASLDSNEDLTDASVELYRKRPWYRFDSKVKSIPAQVAKDFDGTHFEVTGTNNEGKHYLKVRKDGSPLLAKSRTFHIGGDVPVIFIPSGQNGPQQWKSGSQSIRVCILCGSGEDCRQFGAPRYDVEYKRPFSIGWKRMDLDRVGFTFQQTDECRDFFQKRFPGRHYEAIGLSFKELRMRGRFNLRARYTPFSPWKTPVVIQTNKVPRIHNVLQYVVVDKLVAMFPQQNNDVTYALAKIDRFAEFPTLAGIYPKQDAIHVLTTLESFNCLNEIPIRPDESEKYWEVYGLHHLTSHGAMKCIQDSRNNLSALKDYSWILEILFRTHYAKMKEIFTMLRSLENQLNDMAPFDFHQTFTMKLSMSRPFSFGPFFQGLVAKYRIGSEIHNDKKSKVMVNLQKELQKIYAEEAEKRSNSDSPLYRGLRSYDTSFSTYEPRQVLWGEVKKDFEKELRNSFASLGVKYKAPWYKVKVAYDRARSELGPRSFNQKPEIWREVESAFKFLKDHVDIRSLAMA